MNFLRSLFNKEPKESQETQEEPSTTEEEKEDGFMEPLCDI